MPISWLALAIAVSASVVANISLKLATKNAPSDLSDHAVTNFLLQPWTWVGLLAGVVLLGSYVIAIREIGLAVSYATVTCFSLVLVVAFAAILFQERFDLTTIIGIVLVISGIIVLARTQIMDDGPSCVRARADVRTRATSGYHACENALARGWRASITRREHVRVLREVASKDRHGRGDARRSKCCPVLLRNIASPIPARFPPPDRGSVGARRLL